MDNVNAIVKTFILEQFLPGEDPRNLTDATHLKESGILDSLSTLKLVTFLEHQFHIELEASDLDAGNMSTVADIARMVETKRSATA